MGDFDTFADVQSKKLKNMKTRIFQILGVAAVASLGLASCDTDACKDVDCGMYGECVEGDCVCDAGFEGTNCETESRADFLGSYLANESECGLVDYNATIAASGQGADKIAITGFGGFQCNGSDIVVIATVSGDDVTVESNQSYCGGDLVINSGTGSINGSGTVVTITYNYTDLVGTGSCTTVYSPL